MGEPDVTVAVPVKDRRERMLRCLDALLAQDHPSYEVIVLDNGSSDGTAQACRERAAGSSVPLRVEIVERRYRIPASNPFRDSRRGRPEIFAYGLRNPYRFSFDRESGDLYIGDVGQNAVEEIDYLAAGTGAGTNFGWSCLEGRRRFKACEAPGSVAPIIERPSSGVTGHCASITGGYVVRDRTLKALAGRYLYSDFCESKLRSALVRDGRAQDDRELGIVVPWPSSFGEDERGRIYVTQYFRGAIYRLVAAG